MQPTFTFSPFASDVSTGKFVLDDALLRQALAYLNIDCIGVYGLRAIRADGSVTDIGLMDPRRRVFEEYCKRIGSGRAELEVFREVVPSGEGLIVNSPQNPTQPKNPFNSLARLFLAGAGFTAGCFPETIDMNLFIGSYERGFTIHRDAEDTALFVLDGQKHFRIGLQEDLLNDYTITRGQYLRWRSIHWHGNTNPIKEWSITINFAVGPAGSRMTPVGTPVDLRHQETKMNDYLGQMMALHAAKASANKI